MVLRLHVVRHGRVDAPHACVRRRREAVEHRGRRSLSLVVDAQAAQRRRRHRTAGHAAVGVLPPALGGVLDLGVRVALVRVAEPRRALLLAAHQRDPLVAAAAEALPDVGVAVHASLVQRLLEGRARRRADAVRKRLVVPVGRVLEHQPAAGLADAAPALALVAVAAHPLGRVHVAVEAQLLLVRDHVGVGGVHVLGRWRERLLVEGRVQVGWRREVGVVAVKGVRVEVVLEQLEKAV